MDGAFASTFIAGLTGLADGDYDDVDEQAFYLIGDMSTLKDGSLDARA